MCILSVLDPEITLDGWGIALLIFLLGEVCVDTVQYLSSNKIRQVQKAGKKSRQKQKISAKSLKSKNKILQKQKAGKNSNQSQNI